MMQRRDLLWLAGLAAPGLCLTLPALASERELRIVLEIALYKHRMDSALRDSEDRYRSLVNNLQSGVILMGPRGEVLLANDRAMIFGS